MSARSAIPPRWIPIARDLGLGELEGRIWMAGEAELEEIRGEAARRRDAAAEARRQGRARAREARAKAKAEADAKVERLRAEWRALCEEGGEVERAAWIELNEELLDSPLGRRAFGIEPIASTPLFFAVLVALRGMRAGRPPPAAIQVAARKYGVQTSEVASIVGRVGGRRLGPRAPGATIGVKAPNEWRDVERSPEEVGACAPGETPAKVGREARRGGSGGSP